MYDKILLPTDGSGYAEEEVDRVSKLISDDGEIIVLSVAAKITNSAFRSRKKVQKLNERLKKESEIAVQRMVEKFDDNLNVTPMLEFGFPAETINRVVEENDVDLIVISASGKSGLHKFVIGSVAKKVLETAEIDVLLIHNK